MFPSMDANVIGYWNDVANYISGHPIDGNITYTVKGIGGQAVVNGQYQATGPTSTSQTRLSAGGWPNSPGGWSWVGEQGPERMYVPRGASIFSHEQSMSMAPSGSITLHLTLQTNGQT